MHCGTASQSHICLPNAFMFSMQDDTWDLCSKFNTESAALFIFYCYGWIAISSHFCPNLTLTYYKCFDDQSFCCLCFRGAKQAIATTKQAPKPKTKSKNIVRAQIKRKKRSLKMKELMAQLLDMVSLLIPLMMLCFVNGAQLASIFIN